VTIKDDQGNIYTDFIDIRFTGLDFNASLSFDIENNVPILAYISIISLLTLFSGIILRKLDLTDTNKRKLY
jgi:hypothetical protein